VVRQSGSGFRVSSSGAERTHAPRPRNAERGTRNPTRRNRFATYFTTRGWVHALLLLSIWMFLFPFFWMLATSVKTDEELTESRVLPEFVRFQPSSPYVRAAADPVKPADVSKARWDELLPRLTSIASAAVDTYQSSHPPQRSVAAFDEPGHRAAATKQLVNASVGRINRRLWTGADQPLFDEFRASITDAAIATALGDSLSRIELFGFQLRTLDLHIFNLTDGAGFASTWRVESGNAKLFANAESTLLSYHFDSSSNAPVVLRYDFQLPAGVRPADLHKLMLSTSADNSWHRVDLTLDAAGEHWRSAEPTYLAQNRTQGLIFQPPTFDDELMRAKTWVTMKRASVVAPGSRVAGGDPASPPREEATQASQLQMQAGIPATLRVILSPSSTLRANFGKALRNYGRAFNAVPFWRYIGNSVILVVLCTLGSLFSASFVAYAFARLHWPGRSVAFMILLSTMMLPHQVTMIPGFMVWRFLHWYNTLNPLWVPTFFGSAFFIFLMVQHMRTIPRELEEAARLDGLNAMQSWYYVILPNLKPTLAAISILSFMGAWNEFMGPLIYLRDQTKFPLSLGLYGLGLLRTDAGADYSWTVVMAGNILMTMPVIIVFFLFQRYFVQGMTMTGMKG
jgi:multiple sugar transport system permease protein